MDTKDENNVKRVVSEQNFAETESIKQKLGFFPQFPRLWNSSQERNVWGENPEKVEEFVSRSTNGCDVTLGKMVFVLQEKLHYKSIEILYQ